MCGINGVYHYHGGTADRALVARQATAQRHRGPDDWDVWVDGPIALAQRRLAIVDLSPGGHQPMANEDGSVHVTFNGELYNWPGDQAAARRAGTASAGTPTPKCCCTSGRKRARRCSPTSGACSRSRSGTRSAERSCSRATASARSRSSGTTTASASSSRPN
ncbi:MAG: hypothetical protein IPJ04_02060 [Candidatus Eisenbacteria bacterium]|nr:hypothetical protein [Candidatus Eisenbacteria bacterium]